MDGNEIMPHVRRAAALICQIAASNYRAAGDVDGARRFDSYAAAKWLYGPGASRMTAAWLARRAIAHTNLWQRQTTQQEVYANAEALLQTGWTP
jgi:hypothetical protein